MSEQFKVGEIAIIQNQVGEAAYLNSREVEIIGELDVYAWINHAGERGTTFGYEVDILGLIVGAIFSPLELRKKRPPITGEQLIRDMFIPKDLPEEVPA